MNNAHIMSMAVDQAQEILRLKDANRQLVAALNKVVKAHTSNLSDADRTSALMVAINTLAGAA